jgi:hypothetical protein
MCETGRNRRVDRLWNAAVSGGPAAALSIFANAATGGAAAARLRHSRGPWEGDCAGDRLDLRVGGRAEEDIGDIADNLAIGETGGGAQFFPFGVGDEL